MLSKRRLELVKSKDEFKEVHVKQRINEFMRTHTFETRRPFNEDEFIATQRINDRTKNDIIRDSVSTVVEQDLRSEGKHTEREKRTTKLWRWVCGKTRSFRVSVVPVMRHVVL